MEDSLYYNLNHIHIEHVSILIVPTTQTILFMVNNNEILYNLWDEQSPEEISDAESYDRTKEDYEKHIVHGTPYKGWPILVIDGQ